MHIGILGTGFGKYHGELFKKLDSSIQLTFWGRDVGKLQLIQSEFGCDYTTDIDQFLDNETFDFVDICLPSQIHAKYALKALEKNHSVFIETPAVTNIEDGIRIMELAKKNRKKVLVNMFLLYDPYYRMIYDLSQSKQYGTLKHLSILRRTPPIWGNLGMDSIATELMIHDLYFVNWLEKDLKMVSFDVTNNSDQSGAIVDCLLSNHSLNVHVHGNSMLSMGFPFHVGYEATFENATISYYEKSSPDENERECYIYSDGHKQIVSFESEEHCKILLREAIKDFNNEKESGLSIDTALPALSIAFELSSQK